MPWRCLPLCVNTVAKFGSQTQELNISLTAVGLMVNNITLCFFFNVNLPYFYCSGIYPIISIKIKRS